MRYRLFLRRQRLSLFICLLLMGTLFATGCTLKTDAYRPQTALERDIAKARKAYDNENFQKSEKLHSNLLKTALLGKKERAEILERLGYSAVKTGNAALALESLVELSKLQPQVEESWIWQDHYLQALDLDNRQKLATRHRQTLVRDVRKPLEVRIPAGISLAKNYFTNEEYDMSLRALRLLGQATGEDEDQRATLEHLFLASLAEEGSPVIEELAKKAEKAPVQDRWAFPYNVILLEQAKRYSRSPSTMALARQLLLGLENNARFADKELLPATMSNMQETFSNISGNLVLALPLSGPFEDFGWRILTGAKAAQKEAAAVGSNIMLTVINTEAENWIAQLDKLPEETAFLGGPVRGSKLKAMHEHGVTKKFPSFTFLSRTRYGVEGKDSWRFFPGTQDEARLLLQFAAGELGINTFGVLYPNEPYGRRYVGVIKKQSDQWLARVTTTRAYNPKEITTWAGEVAKILNAQSQERSSKKQPNTAFKALFIPDGWDQAKILVPALFLYNKPDLLVLGPSIWGQAIAKDKNIEVQYFRRTVFPASWWDDNPEQSAIALKKIMAEENKKADFWVALGYDFVRFASLLPLPEPDWQAQDVNVMLTGAKNFPWSIAPLHWDKDGQAYQNLFLMQPGSEGVIPLDREKLARLMERRRYRGMQHSGQRPTNTISPTTYRHKDVIP